MTVVSLRIIICWIVLVSHVMIMGLSPYLIIEFTKALDVILILMPLTGLYVGIIVTFYASNMDDKSTDKVSINFMALSVFLCLAFCLAILGVLILYHGGTIATIDELKRSVGIIDTGLGIYSGFLIKALFKSG
jgi:hypothetical protein